MKCYISELSSPFLSRLILLQRVLDLLCKHKSYSAWKLPAVQPATVEPPQDTISDQKVYLFLGSAAATLTYDVQSVELEPVEVTVAPGEAGKNVRTREAESVASESPIILSKVSSVGLASVSEVLKSPDDSASSCIQIMCDFEDGPAQVKLCQFYQTHKSVHCWFACS